MRGVRGDGNGWADTRRTSIKYSRTGADDLLVIKPVVMVPSSMNPDFVGREEIFRKLESLRPPKGGKQLRRAALYGLGGIG